MTNIIKKIRQPYGTWVQDGWIGANVPAPEAYDPALYPPIIQLAGSFGAARRRQNISVLMTQPQQDWMGFVTSGPSPGLRTLALTGAGL